MSYTSSIHWGFRELPLINWYQKKKDMVKSIMILSPKSEYSEIKPQQYFSPLTVAAYNTGISVWWTKWICNGLSTTNGEEIILYSNELFPPVWCWIPS